MNIRNFASAVISRVHIGLRPMPFDELTCKIRYLYFVELQIFNKVVIGASVSRYFVRSEASQ